MEQNVTISCVLVSLHPYLIVDMNVMSLLNIKTYNPIIFKTDIIPNTLVVHARTHVLDVVH
jgi:hypothetical protein